MLWSLQCFNDPLIHYTELQTKQVGSPEFSSMQLCAVCVVFRLRKFGFQFWTQIVLCQVAPSYSSKHGHFSGLFIRCLVCMSNYRGRRVQVPSLLLLRVLAGVILVAS